MTGCCLLSQSMKAVTQTCVIMQHLQDLGLIINEEKSRLSTVHNVVFLGLALNSVAFTARLSEELIVSFKAGPTLVVRLGHCHMNSSFWWQRTAWTRCALVLRHWRAQSFLEQGVLKGAVLSRKVAGLGWCLRRLVCEKELEHRLQAPPHTFLGAFSGFSFSETLSSIPSGTSCPGSDRQYNDSGLHQPAGGLAQTDPVELRLFPISQGNTCFGIFEFGSGHVPGLRWCKESGLCTQLSWS